jgi:hypothetical protein
MNREIKEHRIKKDVKEDYASLNQSKKRERVDAPLQKLESWYYKLLLDEMQKTKDNFEKIYKGE